MLALRPFGCHRRTIATFTRNLSMTAHKYGSGGVRSKIPKGEQDPNTHEPRLEARPRLSKELQRLDGLLLKYSQAREQQQKQELQKKTAEIQNMTPALVREKRERERAKGRVQIFWAIEDIIGQSNLQKLVPLGMSAEASVYELAGKPEFTKFLLGEFRAAGLGFEHMADSVKSTCFDQLPESDREKTIVIGGIDFTANELALLITIMKLRAEWQYSLP